MEKESLSKQKNNNNFFVDKKKMKGCCRVARMYVVSCYVWMEICITDSLTYKLKKREKKASQNTSSQSNHSLTPIPIKMINVI